MIGTIAIDKLEIVCIIGIFPHERDKPQPILVDVEIDYDFAAAAAHDDFQKTRDYVELTNRIKAMAVGCRFNLIESFAVAAVDMLIEDFGALRAKIRVTKPLAIAGAQSAWVELER